MLTLLHFGKKKLIVGDSHLNNIKRNKLNNSFSKAKCIMKSFSGTKIQDLKHVTPHLEHYKPNTGDMHIGINNMSYNNLNTHASILAENIIKIGKKCIDYCVEEVVISSVFVIESIRISSLIRKVNGELSTTN